MQESNTNNNTILVLGDCILDQFHHCEVINNPDYSTTPSVIVNSSSSNLGGATNVCRNLHALGVEVDYFSPIANSIIPQLQPFITTNHLALFNILPKDYTSYKSTPYTITRYIDQSNHLLRVNPKDKNHYQPLIDLIKQYKYTVKSYISKYYKAIIISDYGHGVIDSSLINWISKVARENSINVYLDSARLGQLDLKAPKLYLLKLNENERKNMPASAKYSFHHIITTLGERGARIEGLGRFIDTEPPSSFLDSCGCGDTFLSALVYAHELCNYHLVDAVKFAISTATASVGQPGISTISRTEAHQLYKRDTVKTAIK